MRSIGKQTLLDECTQWILNETLKKFLSRTKKRKTRENLSTNTYPNRTIRAYLNFCTDSIVKFLIGWRMKLRCNFRGGSIHRLEDQCCSTDRGGSLAHSNLVLPYWGRRETKRKKMKGRGRTVRKSVISGSGRMIEIFSKQAPLWTIERLAKLTSNFPKESLDRCYKRKIYFFLFYFNTFEDR